MCKLSGKIQNFSKVKYPAPSMSGLLVKGVQWLIKNRLIWLLVMSGYLLLIIAQLPILITNIFLGILFGTIFNDKSAPGICSVFISLAGILGGCWMPIETMGAFESFCRFLPFYPSVYIGRIITKATNALGILYTFDSVAIWGLIPIFIFMISSIILTIFAFKKNIVNDK